jgi:hypothetical protein
MGKLDSSVYPTGNLCEPDAEWRDRLGYEVTSRWCRRSCRRMSQGGSELAR